MRMPCELQLMVIFAWHNLESPLELFNSPTLEDIMSVFVTSAFIRLSTGTVTRSFIFLQLNRFM